jgi:hypothetical protein
LIDELSNRKQLIRCKQNLNDNDKQTAIKFVNAK